MRDYVLNAKDGHTAHAHMHTICITPEVSSLVANVLQMIWVNFLFSPSSSLDIGVACFKCIQISILCLQSFQSEQGKF